MPHVLAALDPTAFDAPARPYPEVLMRVQELIAAEIGRYAEPATEADDEEAVQAEAEEEQAHA